MIGMISAKKQAFREEIRRRQINDKFRNKRKQYIMIQKINASRQERQQFVNEAQSIIYNLTQLASGRDFYMYQGLLDLLNLLKKRKKILPIICQKQYQVIESLALILLRVNESGLQLPTKALVFELMIQIVGELINCPEITGERVYCSRFVQAVLPYMQYGFQKVAVLGDLFGFLGNATRESQQVAALYTQLGVPRLAIQLLENIKIDINIPQHEKLVKQLMFLLRCYFQQCQTPLALQLPQISQTLHLSTLLIDKILQTPHTPNSPHSPQTQQLQDALRVHKQLINYQKLGLDVDEADRFIDIVQIGGYPVEIKREALYILDTMVYLGDEEFLTALVIDGKVLDRIWAVDDQIRFIVFNIFSNVALSPTFRTALASFLPRIRLQMNFYPDNKFTFRFLLNYFTSKKFQVQGPIEQSLIDQLQKNQSQNPEIIQIQAKIWLGLTAFDYHQRPPNRILEAKNIPEVQEIWFCLDKEDRERKEYLMEDSGCDGYQDRIVSQ